MAEHLVTRHVSADGILVSANASYKSFVPIEVALDPRESKRRLRMIGAIPTGPSIRAILPSTFGGTSTATQRTAR